MLHYLYAFSILVEQFNNILATAPQKNHSFPFNPRIHLKKQALRITVADSLSKKNSLTYLTKKKIPRFWKTLGKPLLTLKLHIIPFINRISCYSLFLFFIFITQGNASQSDHTIAEQLGWIQNNIGLCKGQFQDPLQAYAKISLKKINQAFTSIDAAQSQFSLKGTSTLTGNVTISQLGRSIRSDKVYFYRDPKTGKITTMDLMGKILVREPNLFIKGSKAHLNFNNQIGYFSNAIYRILLRSETILFGTNQGMPINAWGTASLIEQNRPWIITLYNPFYTTCSPINPTWQLSAKKMVLNRDSGRGKAYGVRLHFHGRMILYSPYLSFPIDDRRESGFLFPNFSVTSRSGIGVGFPYYWNKSTNQDFLFTPTVLSKRGLQLSSQFRYLTHKARGKILAYYLPYDREAARFKKEIPFLYPSVNPLVLPHSDREAFMWREHRQWSPRWSSSLNFNWVSDDYYLEDFHYPPSIAINQLAQQAKLNYSGDLWNFSTRINHYQTLHPINQAPVSSPYNSLPEIDLKSITQNYHGFQVQLSNQLNYFQRPSDPGELVKPPQALRVNLLPTLSYPVFFKNSAYLTPRLQLSLTHYNIRNQVPGFQSDIQRTIPLFSLDSGIYLDRELKWNKRVYQQTLEPHFFYLYVPYHDQSNIPIFDSALIPFSYDRLFMTNRFSGFDRIGDANQLSVALTTRLLDPLTGVEKLRASLGEIVYFKNRRVFLCNPLQKQFSTPGTLCTDPCTIVGATSPTERFSPIVAQLNYNLNSYWGAEADIAWDPSNHDIINAAAHIQYHPRPNQLFNINYARVRFGDNLLILPPVPPYSHQNDFNRLGFSFASPLKEQWSTVGGWEYNLSHNYSQNFFYGVQYDSCCWAFRVIAGRTFYSLTQDNKPLFNNMILFQIQLKGLSTLGMSDITNFLSAHIPGYIDHFQSSVSHVVTNH